MPIATCLLWVAVPAGMLAAHLAARSGARVILLESDTRAWRREELGVAACATRRSTSFPDEVEWMPGLRFQLRTTAVGMYDHGVVSAIEKLDGRGIGQRIESASNAPSAPHLPRALVARIRAKRIVLATGAFEQPLAFPFNDRPGIMLADAIRHYLNRYAVAAGQRVALATNNDSAYQVALDLRAAGIAVPVLLDTRATPA